MPGADMVGPSRLTTQVDLAAAGRQVGHLALSYSDNVHEYGVLPIPLAVFGHGQGPTVLLTAGTHGDEFEGQVLLHELARDLDLEQVSGRLIIMPALNLPAVLESSRTSPLDGANLNRAYPGHPDGTPTFAIADYLTRNVLPLCDFAADLHSGGTLTEFLPSGFMTRTAHGRHTQAQAQAMRAFGLPYTVVFDESSEDRALDSACDQADVVMISTELGGGASVQLETLRLARVGLRRLLAHWGVVVADPSVPLSSGTRFLDINDPRSSVMATCDGIFEPVVGLGQEVDAGEVVGVIHTIDDLDRAAQPLRAQMSGLVYQRRVPARVRRGSYVLSVATDLSWRQS